MLTYASDVIRHHELLYVFVWRDIKIKYKQSVMGFLWAIFMPMLIVLAGIFVRVAFARFSGTVLDAAGVASVSLKAVAWAFFVGTLRTGTNSLIGNPGLVTKIKFPKILFPLASTLSAFFDMLVAGIVVAAALLVFGVRPGLHALWAPVLILLLALFVFGVTALLSVANLFFRDVKYIVEVIVTFAIFFTPVFYDASMFGPWRPLLMLNPVAPILEGLVSSVIRDGNPPLAWMGYCLLAGVAATAAALGAFATLEPRFAENI